MLTTKLYKLTDENGRTRGSTQWGVDIEHTATIGRPKLCSRTVIHAYASPLLAVLLNPIHAAIYTPQLWEAEGEVVIAAWDKVGCKTLTTKRQITIPRITTIQKVAFAILCGKQVFKNPKWNIWADNWLSGKDRSRAAAAAAAAAAYAANAAATAATYAANAATAAAAAANAAAAATYAANAATYAANAATAAAAAANAAAAATYAANAATYAANAATYAANAAAYAAAYAAVPFQQLAGQAMQY